MVGWSGHAGPNPMQQADCWSCGQADVQTNPCGCAPAWTDPCVIVFDVGQGNCNAIVDAGGRVLAYYDFGYSTDGGKHPTPPTRPCFCDDPLIVLSHWDQDHINLSKYVSRCLSAEWLVPEQGHSDFATKLQKRIKQAGGRLHTVPYAGGTRHLSFPWGYVERCSGAQTDPNGSGLAAFVCVRNSPTHPPAVVGVAALAGVESSALSPFLVRARQAHGSVGAAVNASVAAPDRVRVKRVAYALATVFAASQTAAGRQPHMPIPECVAAAVHAAVRVVVHGENAGIAATWLGTRVVPTLRAANAGWGATVINELAAAAVAVQAERSYSTRVRAAAAALTHDGSIDASAWTWLGVRAAAPPAPALPTLRIGDAPTHVAERFILLNGDAEFRYVPSMQRAVRPRVVAMTAMHHGAIFEGTTQLDGASIPFAPGSRAAQAVLRFRAARVNAAGGLTNSVVSIATEAGLALQRRRQPDRRRSLRVGISRAVRAAAGAIHALELAHPGELAANPEKFAAVAAAATVAAQRHPDACVVGLAACLASTTRNVAAKSATSPIETVVDVAHRVVASCRAGAPLAAAELTNLSAGALDGNLLAHVVNIATTLVAGGNLNLNPDNAGEEAASALGELWAAYRYGLSASKAKDFKQRIELNNQDEDVLNDLATAATASIQASAAGLGPGPGPAIRHVMATATDAAAAAIGVAAPDRATLAARTSATAQASYWAAPALLVDFAALLAAKLAAERVVAYAVGTTVEAVRAVIESARNPNLRCDAYRAFGHRRLRANGPGGQIAYSYGVDVNNHSHGYAAQTVSAGYCGHAHPLAVIKYEARGWIQRYNASSRARHPGAQGDPDSTHPYGHVRLAWDSIHDREPDRSQATEFKCKTCGKSYTLSG